MLASRNLEKSKERLIEVHVTKNKVYSFSKLPSVAKTCIEKTINLIGQKSKVAVRS